MLNQASANDVASETLLRIFTKLGAGLSLDDAAELVPVIANGLAIDEWRRLEMPAGLGNNDDRLGRLIAQHAPDVDESAFDEQFDSTVRELPADDFHAFVLTDLRGLDERAAASLLGVSQQEVNRRRTAAQTTLRKEMS